MFICCIGFLLRVGKRLNVAPTDNHQAYDWFHCKLAIHVLHHMMKVYDVWSSYTIVFSDCMLYDVKLLYTIVFQSVTTQLWRKH